MKRWVAGSSEILKLRKTLEGETRQKEKLEEEIAILQSQLLQLSFEANKVRRPCNLSNQVTQILQVQKEKFWVLRENALRKLQILTNHYLHWVMLLWFLWMWTCTL